MCDLTTRKRLCALLVAVAAAWLCAPDVMGLEKKKAVKSKSVADFAVPKGSTVAVILGYHHHLENNAGSATDTNNNYAGVAVPAAGTSTTTNNSKTTTYDFGQCDSDWTVTIDNILTDVNHILIKVDKLESTAQAPKPDRDSSATSKERVVVSGNIVWSQGESIKKEKKKASKKSAVKKKKVLTKKQSKKKAKPSVISDIKDNGFHGAEALALVDTYADVPGVSFTVSEDYLEVDGVKTASHTFGSAAADNSQVFVDLDDYVGFIRLEGDPDYGWAGIDSFFDVVMSGSLTPVPDGIGSVRLVEGDFLATGCYDVAGWVVEGSPGAYSAAMLPIGLLPEVGWDIEEGDLTGGGGGGLGPLQANQVTLYIEDAAYSFNEAVPEPAGLATLGLAALALKRRRRH